MVTVNYESPLRKTPIKGELLCKMIDRYPSIDVTTVQLVSHIQAIGKSVSMIVNQSLAEHGLTEAKFYVLTFLFSEELLGREAPGPSQIADHIGVTRGTITGLLDGLEREGFIDRIDDPRDRRALTITINDKARNLLDSFLPTVTSNLERFMPLTREERRIVIDLLAKIDQSLSESDVIDGQSATV